MAPIPYSATPQLDSNRIKISLHLTYYDFSAVISRLMERICNAFQQEPIISYLALSIVIVISLFGLILIAQKLKWRHGSRFTQQPRHVRNKYNLRTHAIGNTQEYQRNVSAMLIEGEEEARIDFEPHLAPLYTRTGKQQVKRLSHQNLPNASDKVQNQVSQAPSKGHAKVSTALPDSSFSTQATQEKQPIGSALSRHLSFYSTRNDDVEEEASIDRDALNGRLVSQALEEQRKRLTWSHQISSYFTRSSRGQVNACREQEILTERLRRAITTPRNTNSLFMIGRSPEEFPDKVPRMPSEGPEEAMIDWLPRFDPLYLHAKQVKAERAARQASKRNSREGSGPASPPKGSSYSSQKGKGNALYAAELPDELTPLLSATNGRRPSFSVIQSSNSRAERYPSGPSGTVRRPKQHPIDEAAQDDLRKVTTIGKEYASKNKKGPMKNHFDTKGYKDANDEPHVWQSKVALESSGDFLTDSEEVEHPTGMSSRNTSLTQFGNHLAIAGQASKSAESKKLVTRESSLRPTSSSTQSETITAAPKSLPQPIPSSTEFNMMVTQNPSSQPPSSPAKSIVTPILVPGPKKIIVIDIIKKFEVTAAEQSHASPKRTQSTYTQSKSPEKSEHTITKESRATAPKRSQSTYMQSKSLEKSGVNAVEEPQAAASKRSQSTYTKKNSLEKSEVNPIEQSQAPVTKRSQSTYRGKKLLKNTSLANHANKRTYSSRIPVRIPTLPPFSTIPVIDTTPVTAFLKTTNSKIPVVITRLPAFDSPSGRNSARKFPQIDGPTGFPAPSSPGTTKKGSARNQTPAQSVTPTKATRRSWK